MFSFFWKQKSRTEKICHSILEFLRDRYNDDDTSMRLARHDELSTAFAKCFTPEIEKAYVTMSDKGRDEFKKMLADDIYDHVLYNKRRYPFPTGTDYSLDYGFSFGRDSYYSSRTQLSIQVSPVLFADGNMHVIRNLIGITLLKLEKANISMEFLHTIIQSQESNYLQVLPVDIINMLPNFRYYP